MTSNVIRHTTGARVSHYLFFYVSTVALLVNVLLRYISDWQIIIHAILRSCMYIIISVCVHKISILLIVITSLSIVAFAVS